MVSITSNTSEKWIRYLDHAILYFATLVPIGIVIGNTGYEIAVAMTGLSWLIRAVVVRENPFCRIKRNPAVWAWAVWVSCIILSVLINGSGSKGLLHDIVFIRFFLFICAVLDLSYRRNVIKYLVWGLAAGVLFAALNTLICYVLGYDFFGRSLARYTGKLRESARIAGMCAMAFPFLILWAVNVRMTKKWKLIAFIGIIAGILVVQTTIRTALISSFCGIFAGVFFLRFKNMGWVEKGLWLWSVVAGIWIMIKLMEGWSLPSMYDRVHIWQVVLAMWKQNTVLGVGVSSFHEAFISMAASGTVPPYVAPNGLVYTNLNGTSHAHNIFLMLLSTTGILGLLSFLWLFVCCILSAIKNRLPWRYGIQTWPVVFLIIGLTGWNIYANWYQALFSFFAAMTLINQDSFANT